MDCGPASLRMIAAYYGKHFSQQRLRELCHISKNGVSMLGISDAAESIGLRTMGAKISWEQLCEEANLPCIVHWNQQHFVVVYKIKQKHKSHKIYVADPAKGLLVYPEKSFLKCWQTTDQETKQKYGIVLLLEPTPEFYENPEDQVEQKKSFRVLFKYLIAYKSFIIQVMLAMIIGSVLSMITPFITQSVVDKGIGTNDINFVVVMLVAQVMLSVGQLANNMIRSWLMLHITSRMSIALISDFLNKLMKLPIAFFSSKHVGDIMQRIGDHSRIQTFLTGSVLGMGIGVFNFLIYSIIMGGYNLTILLIFLAGSFLHVYWITLFLKRRKKLDYMRFQESATNQNNLVQLVNGMQEIKMNNCEKQKRWEWERIQVKLYHISIKGLSLGQTQTIGGSFIAQTKDILISYLAARSVIDGNMTLGMMMAMQYILGQLNGPISNLVSFIQSMQDAKISLERLNEIHAVENEADETSKIYDIPTDADIEFRDVVFQYDGPHSEKVLNKINLTIPANKVTAIVGVSGSGKTTLLKLIMGFYNPVEGEILLDGRSLMDYSQKSWRMVCGTVLQDGFIFTDTISNNICISDETPNMSRLVEATRTARIYKFISNLPRKMETRIGADGQGLSTGQKQRILIARAIYKNPQYLLLDEATNSLDANNEKDIMTNLHEFFKGKTVVIVAHRLSTVRHADNIVVLDKGSIVEEGTHDQLVALKGYYYNLVKNQLELGD